MKLYYSAGACSLAVRIVANEAAIALDTESVDLAVKTTASGADYRQINPKALVPALVLDDGSILTEGPVIMQYLADREPHTGLTPAFDTMARYRLLEILGYLNSEIHKGYSPMFHAMSDEARADRKALVQGKYLILEDMLKDSQWLLGDQFSVADAYLFTLTNWAPYLGVDLSAFTAVAAFQQRVATRPKVQAALEAEGLAATA
ncbi:glutathione transferase GstA [Paraburkholderia tropica]|uniref:glutathione transferase GstA n=1 Tax=Paraburkholderia tropica TaxID=92647 RepID=UPI0007EC3CEE|nr:glutathione transferase GstA [Paraburkholderia tropica]OBR54716.1 glutathione S-transferase [Paraburkholderia tropica]